MLLPLPKGLPFPFPTSVLPLPRSGWLHCRGLSLSWGPLEKVKHLSVVFESDTIQPEWHRGATLPGLSGIGKNWAKLMCRLAAATTTINDVLLLEIEIHTSDWKCIRALWANYLLNMFTWTIIKVKGRLWLLPNPTLGSWSCFILKDGQTNWQLIKSEQPKSINIMSNHRHESTNRLKTRYPRGGKY